MLNWIAFFDVAAVLFHLFCSDSLCFEPETENTIALSYKG